MADDVTGTSALGHSLSQLQKIDFGVAPGLKSRFDLKSLLRPTTEEFGDWLRRETQIFGTKFTFQNPPR